MIARDGMNLLQVAQRVTDMDRAVAFYSSLLDASPIGRFDPPGLAFFALGPVRLLLDANAPASLLYLHVDDVSAFIDRLRDQGVEIVTEPHVIYSHEDDRPGPAGTDEWQAFFHDSEGNLVGVVSQVSQVRQGPWFGPGDPLPRPCGDDRDHAARLGPDAIPVRCPPTRRGSPRP